MSMLKVPELELKLLNVLWSYIIWFLPESVPGILSNVSTNTEIEKAELEKWYNSRIYNFTIKSSEIKFTLISIIITVYLSQLLFIPLLWFIRSDDGTITL